MPLPRYHRFESYWEFEAFDAELTRQLATGQVVVLPLAALSPMPHLAETCYRHADTSQVWVLSSPDNAWRGYFLPLAEALAIRPPRNSRLGCLLPTALVALYLTWRLLS